MTRITSQNLKRPKFELRRLGQILAETLLIIQIILGGYASAVTPRLTAGWLEARRAEVWIPSIEKACSCPKIVVRVDISPFIIGKPFNLSEFF